MNIEDFKEALRKRLDDHAEAMARMMAEVGSDIGRLESAAKGWPGADHELIAMVIETETRRYASKLDSL